MKVIIVIMYVCSIQRDTLKRTCIKVLPPVLVVHLKRFDYDWETNREIKFNNYFEVTNHSG